MLLRIFYNKNTKQKYLLSSLLPALFNFHFLPDLFNYHFLPDLLTTIFCLIYLTNIFCLIYLPTIFCLIHLTSIFCLIYLTTIFCLIYFSFILSSIWLLTTLGHMPVLTESSTIGCTTAKLNNLQRARIITAGNHIYVCFTLFFIFFLWRLISYIFFQGILVWS